MELRAHRPGSLFDWSFSYLFQRQGSTATGGKTQRQQEAKHNKLSSFVFKVEAGRNGNRAHSNSKTHFEVEAGHNGNRTHFEIEAGHNRARSNSKTHFEVEAGRNSTRTFEDTFGSRGRTQRHGNI